MSQAKMTLPAAIAAMSVIAFAAHRSFEALSPPDSGTFAQESLPLPDSGQAIDELKLEIRRLNEELKETTARLDEAIRPASPPAPAPPRISDDDMARFMAEIDAPTAVPGSPARVFALLPGPDRKPLAANVKFRALYGRRLAFRDADNRPFAVDIESVHPGVLGHLGINLDEALAEDARDRANRRALAEAAARRQETRLRAAAEAAQRQPLQQPEAASGPATQTTHITIQQPTTTPIYPYPSTVWTAQPVYGYSSPSYYSSSAWWRPTIPRFQATLGPLSIATACPPPQPAPASGFRFNNQFRFTEQGPYTTIPR